MLAATATERRLEFGLIRQADKIRIILAFFLMLVFLTAGPAVIFRPEIAGTAIVFATLGSIWSFFFLRWDTLLLRGRLPLVVTLVILFDLLWMTLFLIATGGFHSPFWPLLLLVVVFASTFFSDISAAMPLTALVVAVIYGSLATALPQLDRPTMWELVARLLVVFLLAWINWALCLVLERERRASQRIVRHLTEGVLLVNSDGSVIMANPQMAQYAGMAVDELVGYNLITPEPRPGDAILRLLAADMPSRPAQPVTREVTIEGRHTSDLRATTVPCGRIRGQVLGWVLIVQDLTDLLATARLKEAGLGVLSHELRSPLASLRVMAQVLNGVAGELTDAERERVAVTIERETDRLSRLVADLLDIAQLEREDYTITPVPVSVTEAASAVRDLFAAQAELHNQHLLDELPPDFPLALGDPDRVAQILTNLVDNALKYTPAGGTVCLGGAAHEATVEVWVQDEGPGVEAEVADFIFEKFAQATEKVGGSGSRGVGLGLYVARVLARKQSGDLQLVSRPGEGSTFILTLPRADSAEPPPAAATP